MKKALKVMMILLLAVTLCGCAGGVLDDTPDGGDLSSSLYSETQLISETTGKREWNGLYYANRRTKKFHYSNCDAAAAISDENLYITEYRDELVNEGYTPCAVCNP